MVPKLFTLIDPATNTRKYYRLELLEGHQVLSQWGRIGGPHQRPKLEAFADQAEAEAAIAAQVRTLEKKGYQLEGHSSIERLAEVGPLEPLMAPIEHVDMRAPPAMDRKKGPRPPGEQLGLFDADD